MPFDTLEKAQARIVELEDQIRDLTTERDTLTQTNADLNTFNNELRELNQKYFNKLIQQDTTEKDDDDEGEDVPSCEDFAKTLNIL